MNEAKNPNAKALVLDTERDLSNEVSQVEQNAQSVVIKSNEDYEQAAQITQALKQTQKKVTEYWEPLRASSYAA